MRNQNKKKVKHLIYSSNPVGFDDNVIKEILAVSRDNNTKNDITGALIYRQDLYLQFLEGPEDEVDNTYKKIMTDKRHNDLHKLSESIDSRRLFSTWAMRGDPVETWMWSYEEVKGGLLKNLSAEEASAAFKKLSKDVDQFN
jgi:hypothetical protein